MFKTPLEVKVVELYPTYGCNQRDLRFLYVDCDVRVFEDSDGTVYRIHDTGPQDPRRSDVTGFWLEKLEDYL